MKARKGSRYAFVCKDCGTQVFPTKPNKHGFCGSCWRSHYDLASPAARTRPASDPVDRFVGHVTFTPTCWLWNGGNLVNGYGQFQHNGRMMQAHRWGYKQFVADVPDELTIDHLCGVKACVNPDHLEPVTVGENIRRYLASRDPKECRRGHPLGGENAAWMIRRDGRKHRHCLVCESMRARRRAEKRRAT